MDARCFECGEPAEHDHHVVPAVRGGTKTVPLCEGCHGKAHDRLMTTSALTRTGLKIKRTRGERIGTVPYGSDLGPDGRTLIPNPAEQATLADIAAWHRAGWTLRRITAELNVRGVPTKGGRDWSFGTVRRLTLAL